MKNNLTSFCRRLIATVLFFSGILFAQSAEPGNAFNAYMAPESGVNPLSGTVAFSKPLASISAGALSVSFDLSYSGNVFKAAQNRNDLAPGGMVGLGWSLGHASIVSDPNGSMMLDDDSYYLQTATGLRYRIIKDGTRWWLEHLPYWKVKPYTKKAIWNNKEYEIVLGWLITDDSGLKHWYGDYEDDPKKPERNATEHILAYPEHHGVVGGSIGGNAALYPHIWNISRQEDWDGNWLTYRYNQIFEGLKVRDWSSAEPYTKESYLAAVTSSLGSSIEFVFKDKGEGEFDGEFLDVYGNEELDDQNPDAFMDRIERKFLSAVEIYGENRVFNGKVDLCYRSFSIRPNGKKVRGYVKRLLSSVIWSNENGIEVEKESYDYFTDAAQVSLNKNYPAGTLRSIEGPNCGRITFDYKYTPTNKENPDKFFSQSLPIINAELGYLDDGTPYLVGLSPNKRGVEVYAWQFGEWRLMQTVTDIPYDAEGSFQIGDKNWFVYYETHKEMLPGYSAGIIDILTAYVIVWNGKNWVKQHSVRDEGSQDVLTMGPGYLVKSHLADDEIQLTVPWTRWGKTYESEKFGADMGSLDNTKMRVYPSRNHIALAYIGEDSWNNLKLKIFTFDHFNNALKATKESRDLDDDNVYAWGDGYLFGALEESDLSGVRVRAWHFNGEGWDGLLNRKLNGVQGVPTIQAAGNNYFAVRHNDNDDLSLFDWIGDDWRRRHENKNMVSDIDFDFINEAEWDAASGADFFVARKPRVDISRKRICILPKFKRWGIGCAKWITVPVWISFEPNRLIQRFDKRDGVWSTTTPRQFLSGKQTVIAGDNWYLNESDNSIVTPFLWNGFEWKQEEQSTVPSSRKVSSLGGRFFKIDNGSSTVIYYKTDDRFKGDAGVYLLTQKTVEDPVSDKTLHYFYEYAFDEDGGLAFDYVHNTPLIKTFAIRLPENAGVLKKTLCSLRDVGFVYLQIGLGLGQVCTEERFNRDAILEQRSVVTYTRHRNDTWPDFIYQDRVIKKETRTKGISTTTDIVFNDDLNGLPKQETVKIQGSPTSEKQIRYAAENLEFMRNANRLKMEASILNCSPQCNTTGLIDANVFRYTTPSAADTVSRLSEIYHWEPKQRGADIHASISNTNLPSALWTKVNSFHHYIHGRAMESRDRLGVKSASIYENKAGGLLLGSVSNAGIEDVLLLSGETCNVRNWNHCETVTLSGNATQGTGIDYGRFSKTAVKLTPAQPLKGTLKPGKATTYRFSAWVQSIDAVNRDIALKLNGANTQVWTLAGADQGKWKYIEWQGPVAAGNTELSLSVSAGTEIRLQDIRFLPSDAVSNVSFWNRRFGVSDVQVNDNGVGSYVTLDEIGRPYESYVEDEAGQVLLASRNTYYKSDCRVDSKGKNKLSALRINGNSVTLAKNTSTPVYYTLPQSEEQLLIQFLPVQSGDQVRYQFYPAGAPNTSWHTSCCSATDEIFENTGANSAWVLKIDVAPFESEIYTIHIQKRNSGWVSYGAPLGVGEKPRFMTRSDSSQMVFAASQGLTSALFNGNTWQKTNVTQAVSEDFAVTASANSAYILDRPFLTITNETTNENAVTYAKNSSSWSGLGYLTEEPGVSKDLRLAFDAAGTLYGFYSMHRSGTKRKQGLKAVRFNASQVKWETAGGSAVFTDTGNSPPGFVAGMVSDTSVIDADIALGFDRHLYVAYIGSIAALNLLNEDSAQHTTPLVVLKRLYSAADSKMEKEIWAGANTLQGDGTTEMFPNYAGDVIELNGEPLIGASTVRLASDATHLYLAVMHASADTLNPKEILTVFKGSYTERFVEGAQERVLDFVPLLNSNGQSVLEFENPTDFNLTVQNGIPYISFTHPANDHRLSVIRYSNNKWSAVGNPAFALPNSEMQMTHLAIGKNGTPVVAFKESNHSGRVTYRNQIVPMKYVSTGDVDLTLSEMRSPQTPGIATEFREYLLSYSAHVSNTFELLCPCFEYGSICFTNAGAAHYRRCGGSSN